MDATSPSRDWDEPIVWPGGVHPAADLFPMLDYPDMAELVIDIAQHGLNNPIVVLPDGRLLDGRNRYVACVAVGVEPRTRVFTGDDPVAFVVSENVKRRHLTPGQLAMLALEVEQVIAAEADKGGRPKKVAPTEPDLFDPNPKPVADRQQVSEWERKTINKAAKVTGASGRAVGRAKRIAKEAPDLAEKVKTGEMALDKAEKQLRRRKTEEAEQEARAVNLAPVTADASGPGWRLMAGDFRERLAELPDGCVDLIVTDPPYPAEFLPLWSDLAKHAARILRPQGVLAALTGQIMLPEVIARLGEHLQYGWVYVQPLPGSNSRIMARHTLQSWKPWVAFSNGPWPSGRVDWHEDVLSPSDRTKSQFRWEQDGSPAEYLIEVLSPKGGMVLDPFAGTAAYGQAALSRDREFIGCEADADRFAKAQARLM